MTADEIAELRALAGAATPGPIDVRRFDNDDGSIDHQLQADDGTVLGYASDADGNGRAKGDAALWSIAWTAVPRLCDEIERLRSDVERLTRELREARAAIRAYTPRCFVCSRSGTKAWAGQRHRYCDAHADTGHSDVECAPAIRTAEKDGDE